MRRVLLMSVVSVGLCVSAGCGLYSELPEYRAELEPDVQGTSEIQQGSDATEGDACGPCGLGVWGPDFCNLGQLAGIVEETTSCEKLVFVDEESGVDVQAAGGKERPFKTIAKAIEYGGLRDARVVVIGGDAAFAGPITLGDGLSIVGGFTREWAMDVTMEPTIRVDANDPLQDSWALLAKEIDEPTYLRNLRIESLGAARTHYALRIIESQGVVIEGVQIEAGAGAAGEDGQGGSEGDGGGRGENSGNPERRDPGAGAINTSCVQAKGGAGGRGAFRNPNGSQAAEKGKVSVAGVSGGPVGESGLNGAVGAAGEDGEPGAEGVVDRGEWRLGGAGEEGSDGKFGQGGSGGGGGSVPSGDGIGGGGAGGGAGGCGGGGAKGGTPGGASFGLFLVHSDVVIRDSGILTGDGGDGGSGGSGGDGGSGGRGGLGVDGEATGLAGGDGGDGGDGGTGGDGGAGAGGVSYAILCADETTISVENSDLHFGNGGRLGGSSPNRAPAGASYGCDI